MSNKFISQAQDIAGDLAFAGSASVAGFTWVAQVNEILQMVATAVAIVAGVYAIVWHKVRIADARRKNDEQSDR